MALAPRDTGSVGVTLLGDIKAIFADKNTDRLGSPIAEALHAIEGRPWTEWGRSGNEKPISPNQVARLLKRFGIGPEVVWIGERSARGYQLHQFADAFERYLSSRGGGF